MPVTPEGKNEGEKECAVTDLEHIEAGLRHQPDSPPGLRRCAEQHRIELPEEISQPPQPPKAFRSLPSSKYETPRANLAESNSKRLKKAEPLRYEVSFGKNDCKRNRTTRSCSDDDGSIDDEGYSGPGVEGRCGVQDTSSSTPCDGQQDLLRSASLHEEKCACKFSLHSNKAVATQEDSAGPSAGPSTDGRWSLLWKKANGHTCQDTDDNWGHFV
jgi:hypothetical protein